jgi:Ca2+-binding RTX toxin-like protein
MAFLRRSEGENMATIDGTAGSDNLLGTSGNDVFTFTTGNDTLDGAGGTDQFIMDQDLSSSSFDLDYRINNVLLDEFDTYATITSALAGASNGYIIYAGSLGTTAASNIEQFQVDLTGTNYNDLLIYQLGTRYHGGTGTDTFYADWSGIGTAITWSNNPGATQVVNVGGTGISVNSLERLLVATGSGSDSIGNADTGQDDQIYTGPGNDTITASTGNDTVDGGAGTDRLVVDKNLSSSSFDLDYRINGISLDEFDTYATITSALAGAANGYTIYLGSLGDTTAANVEQYRVSLTGTQYNDLLIYQKGERYHGGTGTDTFYADWSAIGAAITWNNNPGATQTVNVGGTNVAVNSLERLLLSTGSGSDSIKNANTGSDDEIYTKGGNDTITASTGDDFVDGGSGTDRLVVDQDLSSSSFDLDYRINGIFLDEFASYATINSALAGAANGYIIYLGSLGDTTAANIEQFQVKLTGTLYDDLLIYQGGTRYYGGTGTDTFYADWSAIGAAITWNNNPGATQNVNGVSVNSLERLLLSTGSGNDSIRNANTGTDDQIYTKGGNDTITASTGNDIVDGGPGTDRFVVNLDLSPSSTDLDYRINGINLYEYDSYAEIASALSGISNGYTIYLGSLGDSTVANIEQFQVSLTGTLYDDLLIYQGGARYHGGTGTDTFYANWSGLGTAVTWSNNPGATQSVNGVSMNSLERLLLSTGSGNDTVKNNNTSTSDQIYTGGGNDIVHGGGGGDWMDAAGGADDMDGGADSDTLIGGAGADTLSGGSGYDTLTGGTGQDKFDFDSPIGSTYDRIADFSRADDLIRLDQDIFVGLPTGALAAGRFHTGFSGAAQDATDRIIYTTGGYLYFDPDGTGPASSTLFAYLPTVPALSAADFFVVA